MVDEGLCKQAIKLWGEDAQLDMVIEEMAELTKAILKYKRAHESDKGAAIVDIAEEYADVKIMLDQLFVMMDSHDNRFFNHIQHFTTEKVNRLVSRLDKAEERRAELVRVAKVGK